LPIEEGSTISQPYIVALMSQLIDVEPGDKVLEVGTGSGYQAAVLAQMGMAVYSVEIIPALADRTRRVLDNSGYSQVQTLAGDGYFGWKEHAPFDAIIVTAAPDHIPPPLLAQLKFSGNLVIPVGPPGDVQTLWLTQRRGEKWVSFNQGAVRFVPLLGW
jgi:protein-L-isoaspartate(D-aspartate) O-methyltransferase